MMILTFENFCYTGHSSRPRLSRRCWCVCVCVCVCVRACVHACVRACGWGREGGGAYNLRSARRPRAPCSSTFGSTTWTRSVMLMLMLLWLRPPWCILCGVYPSPPCVCGYVCAYVCGCVGVWVCGCVGAWVCGCVGVWVCGCVGVYGERCSEGEWELVRDGVRVYE